MAWHEQKSDSFFLLFKLLIWHSTEWNG